MDEFKFIIPLLTMILVFLSYVKFKKIVNPLSIIVVWWSGWLFVSNFSLTGLFIPSAYTQSLVLIMLIGLMIGSLIPYSTPQRVDIAEFVNNEFYKKLNKLYYLNICFFPLILFYLSRALNIFLTSGFLNYRNAVFEPVDGVEKTSLLFKYAQVELLFNTLVSPMIFLSLLLSIVFYIYYDNKKYFLSSLILVSMEGVLRLGRFFIYYLIVLFLVSVFFIYQKYRSKAFIFTNLYKIKISKLRDVIFIAVLMLSLMLFISNSRISDNIKLTEISSAFGSFLIDYHTFGFTLLDLEISDANSITNSKLSYGRSILGGIDDAVIIFMRRFDRNLISIVREKGVDWYNFVVVGYDKNGVKTANGFYTIVASLYMDGREPFIFLASLIFGFVLSRYYRRWLVYGYLSDLTLVTYLIFMALMSIFMSLPESIWFWIVLIILITLNKKQHRLARIVLYRKLKQDGKLLAEQAV